MSSKTFTTTTTSTLDTDEGYIVLSNIVAERIAGNSDPLFTTSASGDALWAAYLAGLPETARKHYDCHSCRRFIQAYGGLVKIDAEGTIRSLVWQGDEETPPFFAGSIRNLVSLIAGSKVTGVFLSSERTWGIPSTPDKKSGAVWSHLSGSPDRVYSDSSLTASQRMSEKLEDFKMLKHALSDYNKSVAAQAVRVLKSDTLTRSEKALGIAEWFAELHGKDKNQLWVAVATAPPGYCHIRSTMISTLLDDILAGLEFAAISRRWSEKMDPLRYQRPTAPPKDGAIEAAEKLVEKLGIAKSLERRFALLEDVQAKLWEPKPSSKQSKTEANGVFGHLRKGAVGVQIVNLPAKTMTWEKFARTALSEAYSLEVKVPGHGNFFGLVTAADPDAPPILQWDHSEKRNPVSHYVYAEGSSAGQWGLLGGTWVKANAVFNASAHWHDPAKAKHHSECAFFALEGAKDSRNSELALFPETIKAELHGIRAVIEAYSKKGKIQGAGGTANGFAFQKQSTTGLTVRVDGSEVYTIDRWD